MKKIKLTKGYFAIVDDQDFDQLNQYKWQVNFGSSCPRAQGLVNKKRILMHRLILNPPSNLGIDHINRNSLDNRRCNLRLATQTQNNGNMISKKHSSRFKGVSWVRRDKKWEARGKQHNKTIHLGLYNSEEEAAKTYDAWAKQYFGEFARLNF